MGYLLIDDGMFEHPKIEALRPADAIAHMKAMCWCSRRATGGHIPPQTLKTIGITEAQATRLLDGGVWETNGDGGFVVHDWGDFNPPDDPAERKRWHARKRQQRYRAKRDQA
jgi:hypothetical protein